MDWEIAPDILKIINKILQTDLFPHIPKGKITAIRGHGTTSRAIARIWSLPRPWQMALSITPQYIIEVIAERFDRMSTQDQERTLIHELMHIPQNFGGGFRHHDHVCDKNIEKNFKEYQNRKQKENQDNQRIKFI